jgi:hypothetical protein
LRGARDEGANVDQWIKPRCRNVLTDDMHNSQDAAVAISFMPPHGCSLCLLAHALSAEAVALEIVREVILQM